MSSRAPGVDRHEERQALHVVPVQVGDEGVPSERTVRRLLVAEEPQTGADVEDQGIDAGASTLTHAVLPP
ncbi:MAG: hypothetical protein R2690_07470 [Acidimicrobiales bacterium]